MVRRDVFTTLLVSKLVIVSITNCPPLSPSRPCVERAHCNKKCVGPVLRPIQRFGRMGKRTGPDAPEQKSSDVKNYESMYLSLDEACSHVNNHSFRLLFGIIDNSGKLLGSSVSMPIRVLANNDVPTGAAYVTVTAMLRSVFQGN